MGVHAQKLEGVCFLRAGGVQHAMCHGLGKRKFLGARPSLRTAVLNRHPGVRKHHPEMRFEATCPDQRSTGIL